MTAINLLLIYLVLDKCFQIIRALPGWSLKITSRKRETKAVELAVAQVCTGILAMCVLVIASGQPVVPSVTPAWIPAGNVLKEQLLTATRVQAATWQRDAQQWIR